jgi:hypothetical protein
MEVSEFWQGVIAGLAGLGWMILICLIVAAFVFRKRGQ